RFSLQRRMAFPVSATILFRADGANASVLAGCDPYISAPQHRDRGLFLRRPHPHILVFRQLCPRHDLFHCLGALCLRASSDWDETKDRLGAVRRRRASTDHPPQTFLARSWKSQPTLSDRRIYRRRDRSHCRLICLSTFPGATDSEAAAVGVLIPEKNSASADD